MEWYTVFKPDFKPVTGQTYDDYTLLDLVGSYVPIVYGSPAQALFSGKQNINRAVAAVSFDKTYWRDEYKLAAVPSFTVERIVSPTEVMSTIEERLQHFYSWEWRTYHDNLLLFSASLHKHIKYSIVLDNVNEPIHAYKAFHRDLTCRGFQYDIGKEYEHDGLICICTAGFHACRALSAVYWYYPISVDTRICEVELSGRVYNPLDGDKYVSSKIKIIKELSKEKIAEGIKHCIKENSAMLSLYLELTGKNNWRS